jgi:2-aminoethylphosphonate dioxygenase
MPEQIAQFLEDGFLVFKTQQHGLVDPEDLRKWTQEAKDWPKVKSKWMSHEEVNIKREKQLLRTKNFVDYHQNFNDVLCGERVAGLLKQITGDLRHAIL